MTTIENRVKKLEEKGAPDTCPHGFRVVYENSGYPGQVVPDPGPEICPTCGLRRITMRVVYEQTPIPHQNKEIANE